MEVLGWGRRGHFRRGSGRQFVCGRKIVSYRDYEQSGFSSYEFYDLQKAFWLEWSLPVNFKVGDTKDHIDHDFAT